MDVDPGKSPSQSLYFSKLILSLPEVPSETVVRVLPYCSVPGMLTSSPSYFKAVATVAKQQNQATDPSTGAGSDLSSASSSKGKKKTKSGEPFSFLDYLTFLKAIFRPVG
jgi:hypothetical protein